MNQPKTSKAEATARPSVFSLEMSLLHDADRLQEQSFYSMARRIRAASKELKALNAVAEAANAYMVNKSDTNTQIAFVAALSALAALRSKEQ